MKWQTKKLGDIFQIERGGSPRPIEKYLTTDKGGINWIKIGDTKNVTKYIYKTEQKIKRSGLTKTRIVDEGDFILSNSMSFGRPYIMKTTGAIHDGWLVLRKKLPNIDKDFFYYLLGSPAVFDQFDKLAAGSTVRNLNTKLVSSVSVLFPPLPEQHRIVKILDEVFEKMAKAKENAERNLQSAKELFGSYLHGVFANSRRELEEKRVGEVCEVEYGYTEKAKSHGNYRFVRITDTDENGFLTQDKKMYIGSFVGANKYILKDGDLLMARTGASAGNLLLFEGNEKAIFASYLIRMRFKKEIQSKLYWYFSKSKLYRDQVRQLSAGSAQPQFNGGALKQVIFTFPKSLSKQKTIVARLNALSAETKKLETIYKQKLANLEELKKSVLKKAFAGEL